MPFLIARQHHVAWYALLATTTELADALLESEGLLDMRSGETSQISIRNKLNKLLEARAHFGPALAELLAKVYFYQANASVTNERDAS